jgi:enoyl-CoA hydratase/long-chain 3-hydroxyacyl-CoA dehydrogenase
VFGIGFPPFLGGTQLFVDRMLKFRDLKGPQFEPAQILKDYAKSGKKFHHQTL